MLPRRAPKPFAILSSEPPAHSPDTQHIFITPNAPIPSVNIPINTDSPSPHRDAVITGRTPPSTHSHRAAGSARRESPGVFRHPAARRCTFACFLKNCGATVIITITHRRIYRVFQISLAAVYGLKNRLIVAGVITNSLPLVFSIVASQ